MKKFIYSLTFILIITLITSFNCYAQYDQSGGAWGSTKNYLLVIQNNTIPSADDTYDLGSNTKKWRNLYVDGNAYIDQIGINTSIPRRFLDVLDPNNAQIRGTHTDNTNYFEIQADPNGDAIFTSSGGEISFGDENLSTTGTFGIGETSPETSQEITSTAPYITLHNSTDEKTDGGMESRIRFKGEDPNGVEHHLATIQVSHDGTSADGKGDIIFSTNDGNDVDDTLQERMRIDSSGNVGIGTTDPSTKFFVYGGDVAFLQNTTTLVSSGANLMVNDDGPCYMTVNDQGSGILQLGADDNGGYIAVDSTDNIYFKTGVTWNSHPANAGDIRMMIADTGEVGIGTTAPSSTLDIEKVGTVSTDNILLELTNTGNAAVMRNTGTGIRINQRYYDPNTPATVDLVEIIAYTDGNMTSTASTQDGDLALRTVLNGTMTNQVFIKSSGNVGIGTISPGAKLDLKSASVNSNVLRLIASDESTLGVFQENSSGHAAFWINNASGITKVSLQSAGSSYFTGGNVGLGTNTPQGNLQISSEDTHGGYIQKIYAASSGTLTGATDTIELNIPSGWRILQCQLHVKTTVQDSGGDDTWSSELNDGVTEEAISAGSAAGQNTNVNHWADEETWGTLTDAETDILLTPNGGNFTAGEIEASCLCIGFDTWDNES